MVKDCTKEREIPVGLFRDPEAARIALDARECYLPLLGTAVESWHALLLPVTHRDECNHLDIASPGLLLEIAEPGPGRPLFAMTTVGFDLGPTLDLSRVVDFRRNVDRVREWLQPAEGRIATQVFTSHTRGDDGVTMSIWRDDASMTSVMYRPGLHRTQVDRYRSEKTADRTSFTRFRALQHYGIWGGADPIEQARKAAT